MFSMLLFIIINNITLILITKLKNKDTSVNLYRKLIVDKINIS